MTAKQRKNAKASAKYAPWRNCTCGAGVSFLDVERWHGRTIWKCTRCNRTVYADKSWEVSVAWYIGINGCADGSVTPWNEFAVAFKWNEGAS